jgi:hypothetical protein
MLFMCAFQVGRVELHAPLLLPRSFPQNITTLTTTIEGKPGAVPRFVSRRGVWGPLKIPTGPGQSPVRGPRGGEAPHKLWGFEELQTFIWTTILNQPHHFYQTKKTWLWVLILSDNC